MSRMILTSSSLSFSIISSSSSNKASFSSQNPEAFIRILFAIASIHSDEDEDESVAEETSWTVGSIHSDSDELTGFFSGIFMSFPSIVGNESSEEDCSVGLRHYLENA